MCKGLNASTESVLATKEGFVPRSWQISPNGKLVVVGYNEGLLQVCASLLIENTDVKVI